MSGKASSSASAVGFIVIPTKPPPRTLEAGTPQGSGKSTIAKSTHRRLSSSPSEAAGRPSLGGAGTQALAISPSPSSPLSPARSSSLGAISIPAELAGTLEGAPLEEGGTGKTHTTKAASGPPFELVQSLENTRRDANVRILRVVAREDLVDTGRVKSMKHCSSRGMRDRLGVIHAQQRLEARQRVMQTVVDAEISFTKAVHDLGIRSPVRLAEFFEAQHTPWRSQTHTQVNGAGVRSSPTVSPAHSDADPGLKIAALSAVGVSGTFNAQDAGYIQRSHAAPRAMAAALLNLASKAGEQMEAEAAAVAAAEGRGTGVGEPRLDLEGADAATHSASGEPE